MSVSRANLLAIL